MLVAMPYRTGPHPSCREGSDRNQPWRTQHQHLRPLAARAAVAEDLAAGSVVAVVIAGVGADVDADADAGVGLRRRRNGFR